ncbi:DNA topoisomerase VI subunit B [Candidatus Woesearchaeota archaeon]|nr:DNA topoisomerase VI subunit B [Candidatus Woesearchaeota archaeon]
MTTKDSERVSAEQLAKGHKEVGIAEFFARNKHLLGFDNKRKSLLTTIKEAVDNALDACEEAGILPEITVEIIEMSENRFRVIVEDNGPGIVKRNMGKIFAKLLYGSKFHSRKQQRGQQGIGISAAVMYAHHTTGRPAKIISKTNPKNPAHYIELTIDTKKNDAKILLDEEREWDKEHGTRIELDLEASYQKGSQSPDEYLKQTAVTNPHATIIYVNPKAVQYVFARASEKLPKKAKEILPHPYGVEIGDLIKMLQDTKEKTLLAFLQNNFSRVSKAVANEITANARMSAKMRPHSIHRDGAEALIKGIHTTKIMAPSTDCLSPISSELLERGLKKEIQAEFYASISRPAIVVNGNPLQVEVALAYGGNQTGDSPARLMRFANRVPLLYQAGGCGITRAVTGTNWKSYGIQQSGSNMPNGPLTIAVHISSVWVPFTSESKEAIAQNDEIIKEIKLALQDAGRKLAGYVKKKKHAKKRLERANLFERYIPEVAHSLAKLTGEPEAVLKHKLAEMTHKEELVARLSELHDTNVEYDESFANIGKEEEEAHLDPDEE